MKEMFRRVSRRGRDKSLGVPQPDESVFVVGDVHGCADLLDRLLAKCPDTAVHLVFVGDLIDRGEDSAEVLTRVKMLCDASRTTICLKGNHEQMFLDFLENPREGGSRWLNSGGLQTLASFGVGGISAHSDGAELEEAAKRLQDKIAPDLIAWIARLPLIWRSGTLAAVHAAADPDRSLSDQPETALMWGCPRFFDKPRNDAHWIVHGHSIVETPVADRSRISIDTGAYHTSVLTGAVIEPDGEVQFITA